ncbi:kinase domain-containing [Fusarium longipes]|uniref:Kinase domain-containing n=1 Tax=Fusarium longipes TaxID=694270 RepID=A0A395TBA1_9HYPO|nr:kinase domain-containing [Fusarium longipes]
MSQVCNHSEADQWVPELTHMAQSPGSLSNQSSESLGRRASSVGGLYSTAKSVTLSVDTHLLAGDTKSALEENESNSIPVSADVRPSSSHPSSDKQVLTHGSIEGRHSDISESTLGTLIRDGFFEPSDTSVKKFLPRDKLESILTEDMVLLTLKEEGCFTPERQREIAQQILHPTDYEVDTQPHLRCRKEILVILSLIEKVSTVEQFLEDNVFDYDLPFTCAREPSVTEGQSLAKSYPAFKTIFAIKKLDTSDKKISEDEISNHYRFGDKDYPHLIRLLWTFSIGPIHHLVFPCADGNLWDLWKQYEHPLAQKRDYSTALWFARQCLGIVEGLSLIHRNCHEVSSKDKQHGRHGDLKPENILWFKSENTDELGYILGTLKLTDFGLTEFHGTNSRSGINAAGVGFSPTYRAPEYDVHMKVSQSYDIWSLACVLLEFTTWYLKGWTGVDSFSTARLREETSIMREDTFFNHVGIGPIVSAMAKASVNEEVHSLYEHADASDFIIDLVTLIKTDLLRMDPGSRKNCSDVHKELGTMFDNCLQDRKYCLEKVKTPPSRKTRVLSRIESPDLPRTVQTQKRAMATGSSHHARRRAPGSPILNHYPGPRSSPENALTLEHTLVEYEEQGPIVLNEVVPKSPGLDIATPTDMQEAATPATETGSEVPILNTDHRDTLAINSNIKEDSPEHASTEDVTLHGGHVLNRQRVEVPRTRSDDIRGRLESEPSPGSDHGAEDDLEFPAPQRRFGWSSLGFWLTTRGIHLD